MKPPIDDAGPPAISNWCELIANAAEQLVEAFDQLQLPLRELLFLPLQRLPFLYQRAKRPDECIGHESLHASSEKSAFPITLLARFHYYKRSTRPGEIAHLVVLAKVDLTRPE